MGTQFGEPRLGEMRIDGFQQRPDQALRQPRIAVSLEARCYPDDLVDQLSRRREEDIGANAVGALADAQRTGELLGDPTLNAARWHSDDLRSERIGQRFIKHTSKRAGEMISAISAMDVQHSVPTISSLPTAGLPVSVPRRTVIDRAG